MFRQSRNGMWNRKKKKKFDGRSRKIPAAPLKNDQQAAFLLNCFSEFEFPTSLLQKRAKKKYLPKIDKALEKLLQKSDFEACIMSNAYAIAFEIEF